MTGAVPEVDLRRFREGDEASRARFSSELMDALTAYGFVTVVHHRVSTDLIERAYAAAERLFALPEEALRSYSGALRGYTPFGVEHARDCPHPDLKSFWQVGHESPGAAGTRNVWPDELPEVRAAFLDLFDHLFATGGDLLEALAPCLGVPEDFFRPHVEGGTSLLRVLHYPPIPGGAPPGSLRSAPHEDINLMTLMPAPRGPGLELRLRDGTWLAVDADPDALVVDTGDLMARWSNGRLPATTHRVVNGPELGIARYAMPFFLQPRPEVVLDCLPACREHAPPLPPITVGELLALRLAEIGLPPS